jgi:hypothetical protein
MTARQTMGVRADFAGACIVFADPGPAHGRSCRLAVAVGPT